VRDKIASKAPGAKLGVYAVDLQSHQDVEAAVKSAIAELGPIDILINNVRTYALFGFTRRSQKNIGWPSPWSTRQILGAPHRPRLSDVRH
jgi:NAD(P)-dependent dehydrogenase (short-subunit alcohol dehydrogenase family)